MKILEICPFSSGICGVWGRVKQESLEFSKLGNEVRIFSSNIEKGTNKIVEPNKKFEDIEIFRFPHKTDWLDKLASKNVTYFNFEKQLEIFSPDLVITHLLHPHSFKALKICKEMNIPIFLVTHAPFNVKRNFFLNIITAIQRLIQVKPNINKFTKIISITKWEIPYLLKLGANKDKIEYIPNGIPEEFFIQKKSEEKNKVLFLGRIAPIKSLETLFLAAKKLSKIEFSIVGLAEEDYIVKLNKLKPKNVKIYPPIYDLKKKIELIDKHKIFVLPSLREAMPQVLIEAMSRGKIVISSNTDGGKEIIKDGENGFLFEIGNVEQLAELIENNLQGGERIKQNTKDSAQKYSWKKLIKKYETILEK